MDIYNEIIIYKYDLIKIMLFRKESLSKKELESIKEKLILINKILKNYKNNQEFIFDQNLFDNDLRNKTKTR